MQAGSRRKTSRTATTSGAKARSPRRALAAPPRGCWTRRRAQTRIRTSAPGATAAASPCRSTPSGAARRAASPGSAPTRIPTRGCIATLRTTPTNLRVRRAQVVVLMTGLKRSGAPRCASASATYRRRRRRSGSGRGGGGSRAAEARAVESEQGSRTMRRSWRSAFGRSATTTLCTPSRRCWPGASIWASTSCACTSASTRRRMSTCQVARRWIGRRR
mmetsp:Transcript_10216/g.35774  ORF Transcript_10216/g.35774 Transcript_10216/m.35774 type:complete len:218 (-) Transcript_10216:2200-2853(-)